MQQAPSGLLYSLTVTPANKGDGKVAHRLIRRAKALCSQIEEVLGDTAYGGANLHFMARRLEGVEILAPPVPVSYPHDRFRPEDFQLDVKGGVAVCPSGETAQLKNGKSKRYFYWGSSSCSQCPQRDQCIAPTARYRKIIVHPQHEELVAIRQKWANSEERAKYRRRAAGERLINEVVRRGCRRARAWGLASARLQATIALMGCNLAMLAKALSCSPLCSPQTSTLALAG